MVGPRVLVVQVVHRIEQSNRIGRAKTIPEIGFFQHEVLPWGNRRSIGDDIDVGIVVIHEHPTTDIGRGHSVIVELDPIAWTSAV